MPASVPSMSIAPLIVTSTTGTTIQALDSLTGETSGMAAIVAANCSQKMQEKNKNERNEKEEKNEKTKKRHWWSRSPKGRPCREMKTLDTARPSRSSSWSPKPLDEDMFPRRIRTNSSQSAPTTPTPARETTDGDDVVTTAATTTTSSPRSNLSSSIGSSPRGSCSSGSSFGSGTSRTSSTDRVRSRSSSTSQRKAGSYEALGTRAIMREQQKLQSYREWQDMPGDRAVDSLVLGSAFVGM